MSYQDILRGIEQAFEDARMPETEEALAAPGIEAKYVIEHFFGKTREDVESQRFPGSLYMEDFTYMTDAAVLYYLPSVLRIMLSSKDDELWIFVRSFLRCVDGRYPASALSGLTVAQRSAIADWAEHLGGLWESHDRMSKCAEDAAKLARRYR